MARRFHVQHLEVGVVSLDERQSNHLCNVLRLSPGTEVELFDSSGQTAIARILRIEPGVELQVDTIEKVQTGGVSLTIAAAVPKGSRADWMVEKLSELGVECFVPLETKRSVVHPEKGKLERWARIAEESAKQCKRPGVMRIAEPMDVAHLITMPAANRFCLSTTNSAISLGGRLLGGGTIIATIGPEGGWTDDELVLLSAGGFQMTSLTRTILRVETAAVAAASIIMTATNEKEIIQ